jgi:hypothetical protein
MDQLDPPRRHEAGGGPIGERDRKELNPSRELTPLETGDRDFVPEIPQSFGEPKHHSLRPSVIFRRQRDRMKE